MLDHISLHVSDFKKSRDFFVKALRPLGYKIDMEGEGYAGLGVKGAPDFWIGEEKELQPVHVAFASPDRKTVDEFYAAAIAAGGKDNGKPGLRKHYHANYYAAFVHDFDGNNIEAVCHTAE